MCSSDLHDMRFDVPCVGLKTLETCAASGIAVLAIEPHRTLVLDQDEAAALAQRARVSVLTWSP